MAHIEVTIDETAAPNTREKHTRFNQDVYTFQNLDEVRHFLTTRYGKMPGGRNKIYMDPGAQEIGFIHSYWNFDVSHNSPRFHQTDWITIFEVDKKPIKL